MKDRGLFYLSVLFFGFILSGCVVRTYPLTRERMDQDLFTGNRGYLQGETPSSEEMGEKKTTRTTQVVEIELHSPIRFEGMPKQKIGKIEKKLAWGNRGYIFKKDIPESSEVQPLGTGTETAAFGLRMEKYKVGKGDTLQKISKKFYGTTKKWAKIYAANEEEMKGPNKIYPGQTLKIPLDNPLASLSRKGTRENLK